MFDLSKGIERKEKKFPGLIFSYFLLGILSPFKIGEI
jgi:hypothetical protein